MATKMLQPQVTTWLPNVVLIFSILPVVVSSESKSQIKMDSTSSNDAVHKFDSVTLLMFMGLLVATILSIWIIKHFRLRFIHETGLSIIYGVIVGAAVTYLSKKGESYEGMEYEKLINQSDDSNLTEEALLRLLSYSNSTLREYTCKRKPDTVLGSKMVFNPEIFFYVLLPPIIFHAGYSMKRKHFFKNFGAIITFAFVGTLISTFTIGGIIYGVVEGLRPAVIKTGLDTRFTFQQCLWYGSIISATDPVTVLAIFHDLHVDVDLYALVFGESVLNDAVAITLANAIDEGDRGEESVGKVFGTIGMFLGIFIGSFVMAW
ncbi:Nhe3 [Bugula neritina]|uniref:Nhe3 n=1 Tax=Bugula neritina TaxID=10212 RepID=A0A7J7J947_BUGNE|nr:Nhe3 [Bugula neritina]